MGSNREIVKYPMMQSGFGGAVHTSIQKKAALAGGAGGAADPVSCKAVLSAAAFVLSFGSSHAVVCECVSLVAAHMYPYPP